MYDKDTQYESKTRCDYLAVLMVVLWVAIMAIDTMVL